MLHCLHMPDGLGFMQRWLFGDATAPQSESSVQASQALLPPLQRAAIALVHDVGVHVHVFMSHSGVAPLQVPGSVSLQMAHARKPGSHTGVAARLAHCVELVQPTHVLSVVSQNGVGAPQSVLDKQATHSCVVVLQKGAVSCEQLSSVRQPQVPSGMQISAFVQLQLASRMGPSNPTSGLGGSNASRPGASALASKRGASTAASVTSGQTALGLSAQETVSRTQPIALRLASERARRMDERMGSP